MSYDAAASSACRCARRSRSPTPHWPSKGVTDLSRTNGWTSFMYRGDFPRMFDVVHGLRPQDVPITEPSLDEVFLHYYQ